MQDFPDFRFAQSGRQVIVPRWSDIGAISSRAARILSPPRLPDRRARILVERIDVLRQAFRATRAAHPFAIDALVVLPDHLHIVMTLPDGDVNFSNRLSRMKRQFTDALLRGGVELPRHRNGEVALWQRRFWEHTIRDDRDYERHIDYIHFNPVKHGLVSRVSEWPHSSVYRMPHSSFHRYVRGGIRRWTGAAT